MFGTEEPMHMIGGAPDMQPDCNDCCIQSDVCTHRTKCLHVTMRVALFLADANALPHAFESQGPLTVVCCQQADYIFLVPSTSA